MPMPPKIRPVILSGGSGTRMWPLSRKPNPKQFHIISGDQTLIQQTALRAVSEDGQFLAPLVLANARHEALVRDQLDAVNCPPDFVMLEPMPRNTAPAIAAAALDAAARDPDEILVVLPADHVVEDPSAFRAALIKGAPLAAEGWIVTFGIEPTGPETGFGYIKAGDALGDNVFKVESFEEKPVLEKAEAFVASGNYSWNAGIFMFRAQSMVDEIKTHAPGLIDPVTRALTNGVRDGHCLRLDADAFGQAPEDSIDYAIMEKTRKAAVLPMSVGWSDVGSWSALWEITPKDEAGNASVGEGPVLIDSKNCLTLAEGNVKIAAIGVEDLIIVSTPDGVLVARRDQTQQVKAVVDALKEAGLTDLL